MPSMGLHNMLLLQVYQLLDSAWDNHTKFCDTFEAANKQLGAMVAAALQPFVPKLLAGPSAVTHAAQQLAALTAENGALKDKLQGMEKRWDQAVNAAGKPWGVKLFTESGEVDGAADSRVQAAVEAEVLKCARLTRELLLMWRGVKGCNQCTPERWCCVLMTYAANARTRGCGRVSEEAKEWAKVALK